MQQLTIANRSLEFLDRTNLTTNDELGKYISSLYEYAMEYSLEMANSFDLELPLTAEYIPTRFMIADAGYTFFEHEYFYYTLNGYGQDVWGIRDLAQSGHDEEEIIEMLRIYKCDSYGYSTSITTENLEAAMIRDIAKLLDIFKFSYLIDDNEDIFRTPENFHVRNWVNPPLKEVW